MNDSDFLKVLNSVDDFKLRRAIERLREGLFDPLGVRLLTAGEAKVCRAFDDGVSALATYKNAHLCICGAYGQGKSHSLTYICQRALQQGFVTSLINLDPRETPFHEFHQVYRSLISRIRFPDMDVSMARQWTTWVRQLKKDTRQTESGVGQEEDNARQAAQIQKDLPDEIPHFFKTVMTALVLETVPVPEDKIHLKKHVSYRPDEFSYLLTYALEGEPVSVHRLKPAFKYRNVFFYKDASLMCKGWEPYLNMIFGMSRLFQQMGFKGWVLLFDEGESMVQARIDSRKKSYQILHRMFMPETPVPGFFPVFAFTDDFFFQVQHEDYDRMKKSRNGEEFPYFERNYAEEWHDLEVYRLRELSPKEWIDLSVKLMIIHARVYRWKPHETRAYEKMTRCLSENRDQESRFKLKGLVNQLDIIHQRQVLGEPE